MNEQEKTGAQSRPTWARANRGEIAFWVSVGAFGTLLVEGLVLTMLAGVWAQ